MIYIPVYVQQNLEKEKKASEFQLWSPETEFIFDFHHSLDVPKENSSAFFSHCGNDPYSAKSELADSNNSSWFEAYCSTGSEVTDSPGSSFTSPIANHISHHLRTKHHRAEELSPFSAADGSSSSCSKSSWSDLELSPRDWNLNPKEPYDVLDLRSPLDSLFDYPPEISEYPSELHFQNKQIEIILQEAVDALGDCCF